MSILFTPIGTAIWCGLLGYVFAVAGIRAKSKTAAIRYSSIALLLVAGGCLAFTFMVYQLHVGMSGDPANFPFLPLCAVSGLIIAPILVCLIRAVRKSENRSITTNDQQAIPPKQRWWQFSLRTLLIVFTVLAVALCWIGWKLEQGKRQLEVVAWIENLGGKVSTQGTFRWQTWTEEFFGGKVVVVDLSDTHVSDLSPLAQLMNPETVEIVLLNDTQVSDLSSLPYFKNLTSLYLGYTPVSDLSPLRKFKNLEYLYLENTMVADLSPLAELKNLEVLYLINTPMSDERMQQLRKALPSCTIHH